MRSNDKSELNSLDFLERYSSGELYAGESPYYIGLGIWTPQSSYESSEPEDKSLSYIEYAPLISLLEDAVDELVILKYVIGTPALSWDFNYKTPEERFTRRLTPERIFPEVDSKPIFTSDIKLQKEREQIQIIFQKTIKTLFESGSYTPILQALDTFRKEEEDDEMLIQNLKTNLLYLRDLKVRVENKKRMDDLEEKERDGFKYQLQDELDDFKLKSNFEKMFVDQWEKVRSAQNLWQLRNVVNFYKDNIAKFGVKSKIEKRVTYEMQLYIKSNQSELEDQLEEWMTAYDTEMERRENKILHLKYNRDQAEEKKHNLHKLYEERKMEMKEWIAFRELRKKRIKASLQIQSWWRGIMVRKKMGPYKLKKSIEKTGKKKK